jgi:hypothetical protein
LNIVEAQNACSDAYESAVTKLALQLKELRDNAYDADDNLWNEALGRIGQANELAEVLLMSIAPNFGSDAKTLGRWMRKHDLLRENYSDVYQMLFDLMGAVDDAYRIGAAYNADTLTQNAREKSIYRDFIECVWAGDRVIE